MTDRARTEVAVRWKTTDAERAFWERVYDLLVAEADAPLNLREDFVYGMMRDRRDSYDEYRFMGSLGFGGKLWSYFRGYTDRAVVRLRVNCYPEDETPERLATIQRTNAKLTALLSPPSGGRP